MAIDPRSYDLDELRAASGRPAATDLGEAAVEVPAEGGDVEVPDGDRPTADAAFERAVVRDLAVHDANGGPTERPYLPALPGSLTAEALIFEWLEYLVLQAGTESAAEALDFYASVGWLGGDAAAALEAYLTGVNEPRANEDNDLGVDDHRVSLHYLARLASLVE